MSLTRRVIVLAMTAALAVSVAACGKKPKQLTPPDGGRSGYPHQYPSSK